MRPSCNQRMSFMSFISDDGSRVTGGPPFASRLSMVSPEALVKTYQYRLPSEDHPRQHIALSSLTSYNLRACSPFGPMSQISRSPSLPLFVPNETSEPSGETPATTAWSRSFVGAPSRTEAAQMLPLTELHSPHSSVAR